MSLPRRTYGFRPLTVSPSVLLLLAFATMGCVDDSPSPIVGSEPESASPSIGSSTHGPYTLDDAFEDVARRVPGFGGAYSDEQGRVHIYLKDPARAGAAEDALKTAFADSRLASALAQGSAEIEEAQFDYLELADWRRKSRVLLSTAGVVSLDIDERANRLVLGVSPSGPTVEQIEGRLPQIGIPSSALTLESQQPFRRLLTLDDRVRPVKGGLRIDKDLSPACTLGFTAYLGSNKGFVTNSHCTNVQGGEEGTKFYQPSETGTNFIGTEYSDPDYFSVSPCPSGRLCRYSDSSFESYDSGVDTRDGRIARTTYRGRTTGSLVISPSDPFFLIRAEAGNPVQSEELNKVGQTTGWTYGDVTQTCTDTNVSLSTITLLCQYIVDAGAGPGDSGSPVFGWHYGGSSGTEEVTLYGVLWGGSGNDFVFSSIGLVEYEIGLMTTTTSYIPLQVEIDGPNYLTSSDTYEWEADVSGGDGNYTYEWYYRINHQEPTCIYQTPWTQVGTSQTYDDFVSVPGYKFQLRLEVSSDVEQKQDVLLVAMSAYDVCPL